MSEFKKNTATELTFCLVSSTDGSAVTTGTTTCYYTLDGGTQATGNTATHEGNGQWSVAIDAAHINGDTAGFLMINSSAIPVNIHVNTTTKLVSELNDIAATAIVSAGAITTSSGAVSTVSTVTNGVTASTVSDKTGYSISGTITTLDGLNNFDPAVDTVADVTTVGSVTGSVDSVTDDYAKYMFGAVWYDDVTGASGTTSFVNGIVGNPSNGEAAVSTLLTNLGMQRVWMMPGSTFTLAGGATWTNQVFDGTGWAFATSGARSISGTIIRGAISVSGSFTGANPPWFIDCEFDGITTIPASNLTDCSFGSNTITLSTGNYDFINCQSVVPGTGSPVFNCASPGTAQNISFRRWSGGIELQNINSNSTVSIDCVSGGTVTLGGADGNVQVRGMVTVVDNRTGSPTLGTTQVINTTAINSEVVDCLNTDTYAEPAQGAPGATISLAQKIGYIYKFLRNKKTSTSTTISVFNDDASTVDHKSSISDDGTTYTENEYTTGP